MELSHLILVTVVALLTTSTSANVLETPQLPEHCLQKRAIESHYNPTGFIWTYGNDLRVYQTKNESGGQERTKSESEQPLLFAVYDIFGFHPNTQQVADKLAAESRFTIAMPDFFRGGWPTRDWPLLKGSAREYEFQEFMAHNGSWGGVARDLRRLVEHYKDPNHGGYKKFGIFGFCWGGRMSVDAATHLGDEIQAAAIVHPANVATDDANGVRVPMYLIPSRNEPDMVPFFKILERKFGADNVGHSRFDDMPHGFAAARGNFDDPVNRKRVDEVIEILQKFFNHQLNGAPPGGRNAGAGAVGMLSLSLFMIVAMKLMLISG